MQTVKKMVRRVLDSAWRFKPPMSAPRIIYYHSVHPTAPRSHRPDQFATQLNWLVDNGYRCVSMADISNLLRTGRDIGNRTVAITFDDGYADNVQFALPALLKLRVSATFYLVAELVDHRERREADPEKMLYEDRKMMCRDDVRQLHDQGMEIGSHGLTHELATTVANRSAEEARRYFDQSRTILEKITGSPVVSYSYPNGQRGAFDAFTKRLAREAGYTTVATTIWGALTDVSDPFELPRCEIDSEDSLSEFKAKLLGQREYRTYLNQWRIGSRMWHYGCAPTGAGGR